MAAAPSWYDLTQQAKRAAIEFNDQHTKRQSALSRHPPNRPEASKAAAMGRRNMQELARVVQQMSAEVNIDSLTEEEASRRRGDLEQYRSVLKDAQTASRTVPQDVMRADVMATNAATRRPPDPIETPETRELADQQLLEQHRQIMAMQDESLDSMERGVHNVNNIARTLNSEVNHQTALLEEFGGHMDDVDNRLASARGRLEDVTQKMNPRLLNCCLLFVPMFCVIFLLWCLKHV